MEPNEPAIRSAPGCSRPLKACLVVAALLLALFIGLMMYTFRMPGVRGVLKCQANMREIGGALRRYHDVNNSYPPSLDALRNDYLDDPSVLRCPLANSHEDAPAYSYFRPGPRAAKDFVVLECDSHRLKPDMPLSRLQLLKDGATRTVVPSLRRILREESERRRQGADKAPR